MRPEKRRVVRARIRHCHWGVWVHHEEGSPRGRFRETHLAPAFEGPSSRPGSSRGPAAPDSRGPALGLSGPLRATAAPGCAGLGGVHAGPGWEFFVFYLLQAVASEGREHLSGPSLGARQSARSWSCYRCSGPPEGPRSRGTGELRSLPKTAHRDGEVCSAQWGPDESHGRGGSSPRRYVLPD